MNKQKNMDCYKQQSDKMMIKVINDLVIMLFKQCGKVSNYIKVSC